MTTPLRTRHVRPATIVRMLGVLALALMLSACGGDDEGSGEDDSGARERVETFLDAFAEGNAQGVCDSLSGKLKEEISDPGEGCEAGVDSLLEAEPEERENAENAKILDIKVDGNSADAEVQITGAEPDTFELKKTGDEWKITDIVSTEDGAGTPTPPGATPPPAGTVPAPPAP